MAQLFLDGFSHYAAADLAGKWDGGVATPAALTIGTAYGRRAGASGIHIAYNVSGGSIAKSLPAIQNLFIGFAIRLTAYPTTNRRILDWNAGGGFGNSGGVNLSATGTLGVFDGYGGTFLSPGNVLQLNQWYYLEFNFALLGNGGTVDIHLNGASIGSTTTSTGNFWTASSTGHIAAIRIGNLSPDTAMAFDMTDVYMFDNTGTINNTFSGDGAVILSMPAAAGTNSAWANTGGATALASVQSNPPDGDTSYIASATVGQASTFTIGALPAGFVPKGVQVVADVRKDDTVARLIALVAKSGVTTSVGPNVATPTAYGFVTRELDTDPNTAAAWTLAAVNALEAGVQVTQ